MGLGPPERKRVPLPAPAEGHDFPAAPTLGPAAWASTRAAPTRADEAVPAPEH